MDRLLGVHSNRLVKILGSKSRIALRLPLVIQASNGGIIWITRVYAYSNIPRVGSERLMFLDRRGQ